MRRISMQHPTRIPDEHLRPMSVNRRRLTADPQMGMLWLPAWLPRFPADADPPLPAPQPRQSSPPISPRRCGSASSLNLMFFNQPTRPPVGHSAACPPRTPLRPLTPNWSRQASAQRSWRLATGNRRNGRQKRGWAMMSRSWRGPRSRARHRAAIHMRKRRQRLAAPKLAAAVAALRQRPSGCATRIIASSCLASRAWYAAAHRPTRITCALPNPSALGRKVSDEFTVPVCRLHHREIHRHGDEAAWWTRAGIEPLPVALTLWRQTHPLGATVDRRIGEDAIGASPTEHPPRAGEVQRGEIDKTNPFPEAGQQ